MGTLVSQRRALFPGVSDPPDDELALTTTASSLLLPKRLFRYSVANSLLIKHLLIIVFISTI